MDELTPTQIRGLIAAHRKRAEYESRDMDRFAAGYRADSYGGGAGGVERARVAGEVMTLDTAEGPDQGVHLETNFAYAFIDTMVANVCPTEPGVKAIPPNPAYLDAAKIRSGLVNMVFKKDKLHQILWRTASKSGVFARCFVKAMWNDKLKRPHFRSVDARRLWFEFDAETWADVGYVIEATTLTRQQFAARVRRKGKSGVYDKDVAALAQFGAYPRWLRDERTESAMYDTAARDVLDWATIYEVYDFSGDGAFHHFLADCDEPLMSEPLPYRWLRNPYWMLTFNDDLDSLAGLSDVKLISNSQDRLNEIDTIELCHALKTVPITLYDGSRVDNAEAFVGALRAANEPGMAVCVELKKNARLQDVVGQTPVPQLSPSFSTMRSRTMSQIMFILGLAEYQRGGLGAQVATEVALSETSFKTRNGRRQVAMFDVITWCATATIALFEELLDPDVQIPVRVEGEPDVLSADRQSMVFVPLDEVTGAPVEGAVPIEFEFDATPYSGVESSRVAQVDAFQKNWNGIIALAQAGQYDLRKIAVALADLLQLPDILADQPTAVTAPPGPPGTPPQQVPQPSSDTIATGALPPGTEPPPPVPFTAAGGPGQAPSPSVQSTAQILANNALAGVKR